MFCNKCGNQIPDGSAFCGKCGNRVAPAANPVGYAQQAAPMDDLSIAISIFVGVMGLLGYLILPLLIG